MVKITTYKLRIGNAISIICGGTQSTGIILFAFGTEYQDIINCSFTHKVITSADMCLMGGDYFSANYKGYSGKVDNNFTYNSNLTTKPALCAEYNGTCGIYLLGDF